MHDLKIDYFVLKRLLANVMQKLQKVLSQLYKIVSENEINKIIIYRVQYEYLRIL